MKKGHNIIAENSTAVKSIVFLTWKWKGANTENCSRPPPWQHLHAVQSKMSKT